MDNLLRTMAIITEDYASQNMSGMWATVITGLVVVFLILCILIGFIYLIGLISNAGKKKEKKTYYAVAFKEIDQTEIQVDVMDGHQLGALYNDWAFEVLTVKEVER